jgi:anti-sigma regulatory factor (Ser/Thr protein kinase)
LGILTSTWDKNQNPMDLLKIINTELNKSDYDKYHLCATALLWDRYRRMIKFAFAGNPGGLLAEKKADGSLNFRELDGGGMCLGLLKEDRLFLEGQILFKEGGYLFLFSDGISEDDILYLLSSETVDLKHRKNIRGLSQEILDRILERKGQDDDMILVAIKAPDRPEQENPFRPGGDTGSVSGTHYAFRSGYEAADTACRWAVRQCTPERIPPGNDLCFISLALREALINAVKHGNRFNPKAFVDLSLFFEPGELRIEISDEGPGFVMPDEIQKIEDISVLQSGGRGLSVMYSIADHFDIDGGTVSLIFREKKDSNRQIIANLECMEF